MKFEFSASVRPSFRVTEAQLRMLGQCSDAHYDATCRAANRGPAGGFDRTRTGCIWSWARSLELQHELVNGQRTTTVQCDSSDLDLCLKIMEYPCIGATSEELVEQAKLFGYFRLAHKRCNQLYLEWQDRQEW